MITFTQAAHTRGNEGQFAHGTQDVFIDGVFAGVVRSIDLLPTPDPSLPYEDYEVDGQVVKGRRTLDMEATEALATTSEWLAFDGPKGSLVTRGANREEAADALVALRTS